MIWHVMKKDFRLLWWLVLIVAAVKAVYAVLMLRLGIFPDVKAVGPVMLLGSLAYPGAFAFLILKVMHQDAAVGATQDWLARPFDRRVVLLAKLALTVASGNLAVDVPVKAGDSTRNSDSLTVRGSTRPIAATINCNDPE